MRHNGKSPAIQLLCLLLGSPAPAAENRMPVIHIPQAPAQVFYLDELALGLQAAPTATRADLARIAIEELAYTYAREAQRAREQDQGGAAQQDSRRWSLAVQQLSRELAALAELVSPESSVRLGIGAEQSVYMTVDGNPVVVNGPRPGEQDELERRIVERFCDLHACARFVPETPANESATAPPPLITNQQWSFSADSGPVCTSGDRLSFQFDNTEQLGLKRLACARVVAELNALAAAIIRYRARGTRVEWQQLSIEQQPGRNQHRVQLNRDGDSLQAAVPTLYASRQLFEKVRPWLISRVNGQPQDTLIKHAGVLLLGH